MWWSQQQPKRSTPIIYLEFRDMTTIYYRLCPGIHLSPCCQMSDAHSNRIGHNDAWVSKYQPYTRSDILQSLKCLCIALYPMCK